MPEAESAPSQRLMAELKVSGHLMNLDAGVFCVVQTPAKGADPAIGLPGVRLSLPPGPVSRPEAVTIKTFRDDGWLHGTGDAAMVRVVGGPAQILVTIYQAPNSRDGAPNLQVMRLLEGGAVAAQFVGAPPAARSMPLAAPTGPYASAAGAPSPSPAGKPVVMDMVAHIQAMGDVGGKIGGWLGEPGSRRWIEGFAIAPMEHVTAADIEYQAVLGRGWSSPWVEGGQFCGSRGMALPVLGLRVRLKGKAAEKFTCTYSASFVDGSFVGPVAAGEACEAESLAAVEAIQLVIHPIGQKPVMLESGAPAAAAPAKAGKASAAAKPARGKATGDKAAAPAPAVAAAPEPEKAAARKPSGAIRRR